ncbi:MAG: hypothetical protein IK034_00685, partial [Bacilli bacterium]|nr:hypothetical protein [Bacilli bacterium]
MDAAKKQTLDRLMEIRAGISVIDSINDKKNEFESLIKGLDNDDAQIKDTLRLKGEKIEKEKA